MAVSQALRRWWRSLKESDDLAARESHPNAASGFGSLLFPVRRYVLVAVVVLVPVLVVASVVR